MSTATTPAPLDDDQLDAVPAECTECGRALKYPSADGLGPVCRRKLRAAREQRTTSSTSPRYRVTYERVGRHGGRNGTPPPGQLTLEAADAHQLAEQIRKDARRYLASQAVEVDLEAGRITAGFRVAGTFTIEQLLGAEEGEQQ